jgi:uncharacterized protein YoaH (UPF0181 family)
MASDRYDPLEAPDAEKWLELDEDERIGLVLEYHTGAGIEIPNVDLHAMLHVIVESQIAQGDTLPVRRKVQQLMAQGLDRHEAIHAIASVLINHTRDVVSDPAPEDDQNPRYYAALRRLTARKWLRLG